MVQIGNCCARGSACTTPGSLLRSVPTRLETSLDLLPAYVGRMVLDIWTAVQTEDTCALSEFIDDVNGGVSVDERNDLGETPLIIAAGRGLEVAAEFLLDHGADVNARDWESGWTPLHRSLYFGHFRVALLLLQRGAALGDRSDEEIERYGDSQYSAGIRRRSRSGSQGSVGQRARRASRARNGPRDNDGNTALDLLSLQLRHHLKSACEEGRGGDVYSFGKADFFLGYDPPNASDVVRPKRIEHLANLQVVQVAASRYHSVAITLDGRVFSWGHGRSGRLGHGDEDVRILPTLVEGMSQKRVVGVAAAENHTAVLTNEGFLYTWGSDRFGQLGHGSNQGGGGIASRAGLGGRLFPKRVESLRRVSIFEVAAGTGHTAVVTDHGVVYTWGRNNHGQLGYEGMAQVASPRVVSALTSGTSHGGSLGGRHAIKVSAAANSTIVTTRGVDKGMGRRPVNEVYQWGHGNHFPSRVIFNSSRSGIGQRSSSRWQTHDSRVNITQVSAAKYHNVALSSAGQVFSWGFGTDNLGLDPPEARTAHGPQLVAAMLPENCGGNAVFVSASDQHTCVVTDSGDLFTWGASDEGANTLGHGNGRWQPVAKRVSGLKKVVRAAAAPGHTVVLLAASCPQLPYSSSFAPAVTKTQGEDEGGLDDSESVDHDTDHQNRNHAANASPRQLGAVGVEVDVAGMGEGLGLDADPAAELIQGDEPLTLKQHCEMVLAREVDLRNASTVLACAESMDAHALSSFCAEFIRQNLDAILVLGTEADRNCLLNATGDKILSRLEALKAGEDGGVEKEHKDADIVLPEDLPYEELSYTSLLLQGVNREVMAAAMARADRRVETLSVKAAARAMRSLRKKLTRIEELEKLRERGGSLSSEELFKVSQRSRMEAELSTLKPLLARAELIQLANSQRLKRNGSEAEHDQGSKECGLLPSKEDSEEQNEGDRRRSLLGEFAPSPGLGLGPILDLTPDTRKIQKKMRCEACLVECPDANAYAEHLRGKRHRLSMAKLEKQLHDGAKGQKEMTPDRDMQSKTAFKTATIAAVTYTLPHARQSVEAPSSKAHQLCERISSTPQDHMPSTPTREARAMRKLSTSSQVMMEQQLVPCLRPRQGENEPAHAQARLTSSIPITPPQALPPQQEYSLLEFLSASKTKQGPRQKKSMEKEPQVTRGWNLNTEATKFASPLDTGRQSTPSSKKKSFTEILEEEEQEKREREEYGTNAWFVARKPRSTSFEGIVQQQRQEARDAEERRITELENEMIRMALEVSKADAHPKPNTPGNKHQKARKKKIVKSTSGVADGIRADRKGSRGSNNRRQHSEKGGSDQSAVGRVTSGTWEREFAGKSGKGARGKRGSGVG
ncbi:unnamed protein product [Discosporangium mesarthrocarpum]